MREVVGMRTSGLVLGRFGNFPEGRGADNGEKWSENGANCYSRAINNAESELSSVLFKANLWNRINIAPVNERQRFVINRMLDDFKGHMTTSKYAKLAKCSSDTALRDKHVESAKTS